MDLLENQSKSPILRKKLKCCDFPTYLSTYLPTGVFGHTNKHSLVLPLRLLMREGGRKGRRKAGKESKAKPKKRSDQNSTGGASERASMAEEHLEHHKPSSANGDGVAAAAAAADSASCGSVVAGYSQPLVLQSYSLKDVKKHDTPQDCWLIIWGKVYDVTSWYVCISLCLCLSVCSCASGGYFFLFLFFLFFSFFWCLLTDIFSKCAPALLVNGKNEGNEDGFLFCLLLQFVAVIIFFFSFFWCVCASSSLSFLFLLVCMRLVDRQICSPVHSSFLFLLVERVKEMRRIIILSVCFLVFCCFFSLSFGAVFWQICSPFATPAFVVNGKCERSEEYHCVCFFRFLFLCSFECYGCGDDDDGGGGGDSRVPKHPGGSLIHVKAGQDCTQLFESYHPLYVR